MLVKNLLGLFYLIKIKVNKSVQKLTIKKTVIERTLFYIIPYFSTIMLFLKKRLKNNSEIGRLIISYRTAYVLIIPYNKKWKKFARALIGRKSRILINL